VEKSADYYMSLPYTVELESSGEWYRASIKELPCMATVGASGSVAELWRLLKEDQRGWIEQQLRWGREVPEPPIADPFWESLPDDLDGDEVRSMLYVHGASYFPLRVLQEMWLQELGDVGLGEVGPSPGAPLKAEPGHHDHTPPTPEGDVRPVQLGKSRKAAWIRLDGPRTERGYRDIEVLDQPLRTDAAIITALTVLEASVIEDTDFERLREALLAHVEAHSEQGEKNLQEVLSRLPARWFSDQKTRIDEEIQRLSPEEREKQEKKGRLPKRWKRWERNPLLWRRSIRYMLSLLRYRRPAFDGHTFEEQLDFLNQHRRVVNAFLKEQRKHVAFLEYGTSEGIPRAGQLARDQVKAALLADVEDLPHREIANELDVDITGRSYDIYAKIPAVSRMIEEGQRLLNEGLPETSWPKYAEQMKVEAERYRSLSKEEKDIVRLAENMDWTVERARWLYETNPGAAKFLAILPHP
jgi:hypothetical protein